MPQCALNLESFIASSTEDQIPQLLYNRVQRNEINTLLHSERSTFHQNLESLHHQLAGEDPNRLSQMITSLMQPIRSNQDVFNSLLMRYFNETPRTETVHPTGTDPVTRFNNDEHNANAPELNASVAESIRTLQRRPQYRDVGLEPTIRRNLDEIQQYIHALPDAHTYKTHARHSLNRIKTSTERHSQTGLTADYILALVWEAMKDDSMDVLPDCDQNMNIQEYIATRKTALIEQLHESHIANSGRQSCFLGLINRIVKSLEKSHSDVHIATSGAGIKPMASESALSWVREIFLRDIPLEMQKTILREWNHENSPAVLAFQENIKKQIHDNLVRAYGQLLSETERTDIIDNLEYINPMPAKLRDLLSTIAQLPHDNGMRNTAKTRLKDLAKRIQSFENTTRTLEEDYVLLKNSYDATCTTKLQSSRFGQFMNLFRLSQSNSGSEILPQPSNSLT